VVEFGDGGKSVSRREEEVVGGECGARFLIRGLFLTVRSINSCFLLHASSSSPSHSQIINSQT